jgi:hypothetical protein
VGAAMEIFSSAKAKKQEKKKLKLAAHTEQLMPPLQLPISAFNDVNIMQY